METQLQIRQNATEVQEYMKDLFQWESSIKKKEVQHRAAGMDRSAVPAPRGKAGHLVPPAPAELQKPGIDPKSGRPVSVPSSPAAAAAAALKKRSKKKAGAPPAAHAGAHTYDHWKKWDKLDLDKMLGSDDEEGEGEGEDEDEEDEPALQPGSSRAGDVSSSSSSVATSHKPAAPQPALQQAADPHPPVRSQEPLTAEAWRSRGNELFKVGQHSSAKECYTRSILLDPCSLAYANRAMAAIKLKDWLGAEEDCTEALQLDPRYTKAYHRRGAARRELGMLLEGAEDFEAALRLEPGNKAIQAERDACLQAFMASRKLQPPSKRVALALPEIPESSLSSPAAAAAASSSAAVLASASTPAKSPVGPGSALQPQQQSPTSSAANNATGSDAGPVTRGGVASTSAPAGARAKDLSGIAAAAAAHLTSKSLQTGFRAPKTSTEFEATWRGLKADLRLQAEYLKQLQPSTVPGVFKSSLTAQMLQSILQALLVGMCGSGDAAATPALQCGFVLETLQQLGRVDRFDMTVMSIPGRERVQLRELWAGAVARMREEGLPEGEVDAVGRKYKLC